MALVGVLSTSGLFAHIILVYLKIYNNYTYNKPYHYKLYYIYLISHLYFINASHYYNIYKL